jgi:hypothetical protein
MKTQWLVVIGLNAPVCAFWIATIIYTFSASSKREAHSARTMLFLMTMVQLWIALPLSIMIAKIITE